MAITFNSLYKIIKSVLGDDDTDFPMYEEDVIDSHLTLIAWENPSTWPLASDNSFSDLADTKQKALLVLLCAKSMLSPSPTSMSYKTPVLSVSRSGGVSGILSNIEGRIAALEANNLVRCDTDVEALLQTGPYRMPSAYSLFRMPSAYSLF